MHGWANWARETVLQESDWLLRDLEEYYDVDRSSLKGTALLYKMLGKLTFESPHPNSSHQGHTARETIVEWATDSFDRFSLMEFCSKSSFVCRLYTTPKRHASIC
jgi:hypothetical protein